MIPKPFYELLPYIYMLIGLFGAISLESGWGKLCSVVLIGSGVVVQQLRARHRAHNELFRKLNRGRSPQSGSGAAAEPTSRRSMPEPRSGRSMPEPRSGRSMPEPRSGRSMPEPRSKRI